MKIIVDADATPRIVLDICRCAARDFSIPLWTVANFNHNIVSDHHVMVGNAPQEADIKVVNMSELGDVVVTQDWGLAALVLGKGAHAIAPSGRIYDPETIQFLLEEREVKARYRRGGGRTRGPKKRSAKDNGRFKRNLYHILEEKCR